MKPSQVALAIEACALMNIPLFLWGAPGVSKSASVMAAARALTGQYGLLFLDELPNAMQQVQGAAYQLVLDGRIGDHRLADGWRVLAAGNRKDDKGVYHRVPDPLIDRFIHVDCEPDLQDWCAWALKPSLASRETEYPENFRDIRLALLDSIDLIGLPGVRDGVTCYAWPAILPREPVGPKREPVAHAIRPEVIAFARFRPGLLHNHDTSRACLAFSTPRGWADVSRILELPPRFAEIEGELIRGRVGDGAASEFLAFLKLYRNMISPDAILANPTGAEVPENVGTLYALAEALARRATAKNLDRVLVYAKRMPAEYAACLIASALRITPELAGTAEYTRWCIEAGNK